MDHANDVQPAAASLAGAEGNWGGGRGKCLGTDVDRSCWQGSGGQYLRLEPKPLQCVSIVILSCGYLHSALCVT